MSMVKMFLPDALKDLRAANDVRVKAARNALKGEAFRLKRLLQDEIKSGAPGGRQFKPLGVIAQHRLAMQKFTYYQRWRAQASLDTRKNRRSIKSATLERKITSMNMASKGNPLYNLYKPIRYNTSLSEHETMVQIGCVDAKAVPEVKVFGVTGEIGRGWKEIFMRQQQGAEVSVDGAFKKKLRYFGGALKKVNEKLARAFFLRKGTDTFTIPARDIIDPFWAAHAHEVMPNIIRNYEAKLRGERF